MNLVLALAALAPLVARCALAVHIRKDLVQIKDDAVSLIEATTTIDSSADRIRHLPGSPAASLVGARGVVYLLPEIAGCQPVKRSKADLAKSYIRLALIVDDGDCPVAAKIAQAQYDGAVGALVYNASMSAPEMSSFLGAQLAASRPTIPIVAVDRDYGETLRLEVTTLLDEAWHGDGSQYRAIFASIYDDDDDNARLGAWELTLISLVVILAVGFCASLLFHLLASRRRRLRRHQRRGSHGGGLLGGLSKRIETLPPCALDRLQLRTVSRSDIEILSQCTTPLDNILNPSRVESLSSCCNCRSTPEKHPAAPARDQTVIDCGEPPAEHGPACARGKTADDALRGCIATCIVCIDDFAAGSKMRILPCGHNYHIECIDPWLTAKSSLCPLCKYDTRSVLTDLERAYSGPRILAALHDLEDGGSEASFDASQPSSYLAESRSRLPMAGAMRQIAHLSRHIAAPVKALTAKVARACRRETATAGGDGIAMAIQTTAAPPARHAHYDIGCHSASGLGAVPVTYSVLLDDDEKPAMVEPPRPGSEAVTSTGAGAGGSSSPVPDTSSGASGAARETTDAGMGAGKQHRRNYAGSEDDEDDDVLDIGRYISRFELADAAPSEGGRPSIAE
ncbi:hypothetical protein LPJ61_003526 [Coemansia biformis]|uniref:RING-type domain-containing protein n=1 Tax=Coemansia biformis TaxID=1286918 RepID=A0A9W7YCV1_9FUNG|nr:hypothetical protein LPJ61_003526 [Coemansia biformis]